MIFSETTSTTSADSNRRRWTWAHRCACRTLQELFSLPFLSQDSHPIECHRQGTYLTNICQARTFIKRVPQTTKQTKQQIFNTCYSYEPVCAYALGLTKTGTCRRPTSQIECPWRACTGRRHRLSSKAFGGHGLGACTNGQTQQRITSHAIPALEE